jgi:hypothetical protein
VEGLISHCLGVGVLMGVVGGMLVVVFVVMREGLVIVFVSLEVLWMVPVGYSPLIVCRGHSSHMVISFLCY